MSLRPRLTAPGTAARPRAAARPSAVTPSELARAGATRRRRAAPRQAVDRRGLHPAGRRSRRCWPRCCRCPDPNDQDLAARRLPPLTDGHLFGTDQLGRDLLSRVLHGGQVSLTIGVLAVVVSGLIGIVLGAAAGYFGGWMDTVVSRLLEAQMSLPLLMMLLLVVALFGPSHSGDHRS